MEIRSFGRLADGSKASLYILRNRKGMAAAVTDYGAALVSLVVPGEKDSYDVVLGYDDAAGYERGGSSFGATVGRYANRIKGGRFTIGGTAYELEHNDGDNTLHSGRDFYNKRLWRTVIPFTKVSSRDIGEAYARESINDGWPMTTSDQLGGSSITFVLDSPDGDQGFPGDLHARVTYELTEDNELTITYMASSDKDTPLNLTNHSYFNLDGHESGSVLDQVVSINAAKFTPTDAELIPTGELRDVAGTPMDLREPKPIGMDIASDYEALRLAGGYDHNYILEAGSTEYAHSVGTKVSQLSDIEEALPAATMYSEKTGIYMEVFTDLPGIQFYTSNGLDEPEGKMGVSYGRHAAACFETQYWPDALNREDFPGGILRAGEEFRTQTTYKFSVR